MPGPTRSASTAYASEDLVNAPPMSDVLDELLVALAGRALVAHVATLEERFVRGALLAAGIQFRNPVIDTHALAAELFSRREHPGPASVRLRRWRGHSDCRSTAPTTPPATSSPRPRCSSRSRPSSTRWSRRPWAR